MAAFVYVLASRPRGALYVGATTDLRRRLAEHRADSPQGFAARYQIRTLVHVERFDAVYDALVREKRLKKWQRAWKIALDEQQNPAWEDLSPLLRECPLSSSPAYVS